jgi:predicted MFS family arabinose efflux permease
MTSERPRGVFAVADFRRLWAAGLVSDAGDWLLFVALPLIVFQLTGSAIGTSIAFLLELIPAIVLAPVAARVAARFDRRRVMVVVNLAQAASLVPLLLVSTAADLPILYVVITAHASLAALFEPAKNSLLPELVGPEALVSANSLIGLNQNLGRLIGGPLGGVLLAFGGLDVIVAADAATYVLSAILIATVRGGGGAPVVAADEPTGVLKALRTPSLAGVFAMILLTSVAQGLFQVLFVLFVVGPLHGGDAEVGVFRGIQAVGAIAAGLALGLLARRRDAASLAVASTAAFGVLSLAIWNLPLITTAVWPYVILFAVVGAPGVIMVTAFVSALQTSSSPALRPGAFAAMGLLFAVGQGVGILLGGLADAAVPLTVLLQLQGAMYLTAALTGWLWSRRRARPGFRGVGAEA